MIIKDIQIDGFGIYNDFQIGGLRKGVNIIYGKNEAGKTTLLKFLRYILFGNKKQRDNKLSPFNGSAEGGRILAVLSSGAELNIERGSKNKIRLFFSGKEFNNESDLLQLLGNASSSLYCNVYSLTLDELVNMKSLSASGVEDKIFSIGMGLGNVSLAAIESDIRKQIDEIYKPGGRTQKLLGILKETGEKKLEADVLKSLLPSHKKFSSELERISNELVHLEKIRDDNLADKSRISNYLKCYDSLLNITTTDEQLNSLPALADLPENGLQRINILEEKKKEFLERIDELNNGSEQEAGIAELSDMVSSVNYNPHILELKGKVEFLRMKLSGYVSMVNDRNREEIEKIKLEDRIRESLAGINPAWENPGDLRKEGMLIHKTAIRSFRQRVEENSIKWAKAEALANSLKTREGNINVVGFAVVLSLLFLIFSITAIWYSFYVLGAALGLAGIVIFTGKGLLKKDSGVDTAINDLEDIKNVETQILNDYRNYLVNQLDLPVSLPLEAAEGILAEIEKLQELIIQLHQINSRQKLVREPVINEFESVAQSIIPFVSDNSAGHTVETLVNIVISEFNTALKNHSEKEELEKELQRKSRERKNLEVKLKETSDEVNMLLKKAGVSEPGEFRRKYQQNDEIRQLISDRENSVKTITSILGPGKLESVLSYFREHGKAKAEARLYEINELIEETESKIKINRSRAGEIKNEIRRIENGADMASVLTGIETSKQNIKTAVCDWLSGRLAIELLNDVRTRFENERQPAVINNTRDIFSAVTAGKYKKLHVSLDNSGVHVFDDKGTVKTIEQLSRGAKEQLLLSLRLGFIKEYEKQAEPLPMLIDEILVNFDPERAKNMAGVLHSFASDSQILMFTCHPQTLELFKGKEVNTIRL
jgi:uncharacterized protein YhaN